MASSLNGKMVALAEGRQLEDLARMLENEGANTLRCPMLSILDHPDGLSVENWVQDLIAGNFDYVILLTGEGLRRLTSFADRMNQREPFLEALRKVALITRGPKPVQALKELKLSPTKVAAAPTTAGVITTLKAEDLEGKRVGVQLYSESNVPLTDFLLAAGAKLKTVQPYIYAPASDMERVADLIGKLALGNVDVIVFTSSPQIERMYEVATERNLIDSLKRGLDRVKIASVGPIVTETLIQRGVRADIQPEQGFQMKNLVVHIKRAFGPS